MPSASFALISIILPLLLISPLSQAALSSDANTALSFYRSRSSSFPSGQVSRSILEEKLLRVENEIAFRATWDKKEYLVKSPNIVRDIQVARFVDTRLSVSLLKSNSSSSSVLKDLPMGSTVEILEATDFWARIKDKKTGLIGWTPLHYLKNRHDDLGVYRNLVITPLRQTASLKSPVMAYIPALERFIPLAVTKEFVKVTYQGKVGFIDTTHFISRADFASLAYHPKKNWIPVLYRNNDMIIGQKGEVVPLTEIKGFVTSGTRGIVAQMDEFAQSPPVRARVDIIKPEAYAWGVSKINGHGEVWWKQKNLLSNVAVKTADTITTDDLLKREIYSITFESKNSVRGLVSSEGVYRTEDGLTWTKIPLFGKQNNPVSIHPNGTWFVGSYKSSDQGKTFEPFIRWDKLAQAIESAYHRNPKILKLTKIEAMPNSQVQISVDTGSSKVKLRSLIGDFSWNVVVK